MAAARKLAIWVVMVCALMWGFWWFPVGLIETRGVAGPWIGALMSLAILPVGIALMFGSERVASSRAALGAVLMGVAVTLYAISASYTDFLRAVLLFYLAPAWSTLIELAFFGRRWTWQIALAMSLSLAGILLISRGEINFDGLGAIGDWMALASGMAWSVGISLMFSSERRDLGPVLLIVSLGGVAAALAIAWADGSLAGDIPDFPGFVVGYPLIVVFLIFFVGVIMAGTVWGASLLPPAIVTYLLSFEILGGVFSAAVLLGERFGWLEVGGTICIIGAVLVEVLRRDQTTVASTQN